MKYYDKAKIGKLIAVGSEHIVFEYGDKQVIKISIIASLLGKDDGIKYVKNDLDICKKYFNRYVLNTQIITSGTKKLVANTQTKITKRYLNISDMKNPKIFAQFNEIVNSYKKLINNGNFELDLVGKSGLFRQRFSNIFVTDSEDLVIIDTTLLGTYGPIWLRLFLKIVRVIILPVQKVRIDTFIKHHMDGS